ncbi:MAG: thymidine phosphorylase [Deltaproteobacteria bacterium]|nr:MAG: thymidine phosphorylase [Deltaproteobacteria bacterium]TNF29701.1 MAG: thymidine phosphorylase [Deltaproteobacteria bacterium]
MSQESKDTDSSTQDFTAYSIIAKKRDGGKLSSEEIKWFISGLTEGRIADYQMSALLMAIYLRGMDTEETAALTDFMLYSGKVLTFEGQNVIDKHSTGGVGDKTSFILAPIAAACGVKVPMISGRGLGHTGGTVDKSEAIPGFKTDLPFEDFQKYVIEHGICMIGQTGEIAPADKKIYALRDVTATIESIPLITASIMSKKLAEGANGLVMDVKTGHGAFMEKKEDAKKLAESLTATGLRFGRNMMTSITDMSQPLGHAIGNSLEIIECIEILKGKGPSDCRDLSLHLAGGMVLLAGLAKTLEEGIEKAKAVVADGSALKVFRDMIERQGGDPEVCEDYTKLPLAQEKTEILSNANGYIHRIDALAMGLHCVDLGGGRKVQSDAVDPGVGFVLHKKVGDKIEAGESLLTVYHNKDQQKLVEHLKDSILGHDIKIDSKKPDVEPLIYETHVNWSQKNV